MKRIIPILFAGVFLCVPLPYARAAEITPFLQQLSNGIMGNVYNDIEMAKYQNPGLEGFDENAVSKNQYGIDSIHFISKAKVPEYEPQFEFGITITGIDDDNFSNKGTRSFELEFPLLGIKFSGYQIKNSQSPKFDLVKYIQEEDGPLLEEQNKKMPILLSMETDKDVYKVGDEIQVKISITNVSDKALGVRQLSPQTLYFVYKDTSWGEKNVDKEIIQQVKKSVLEPDESLSKTFIVSGINTPQALMFFCTYRMTFKGVPPTVIKKIKVVSK